MTPTLKGDEDMKLLKIEDNKGHYFVTQDKFATVDKITKDDILRLVSLTLDMNQEVEFDEYDVDNLKNKAHQIIYKSIVEKLQELKTRRKEYTDESERLYLTAYEKYREELETVDDTPPDEPDSADETLTEDTGDSSTDIDIPF